VTSDLLGTPDRAVLFADGRLQSFRGRRALVTGGLGFIGSNLVHALLSLGCEVTVIDNLEPEQGGNRFNLCGIEDQVDVRIADIRDEDAIAAAVRDQDYVFHLASVLSHTGSLDSAFHDLDINVRGTLCVLEAVRRLTPQAHVVYGGTRSEYGLIQTTPVREDHPLLPTEVNSANRAAATLYQVAYHAAHGLHTTSLRLPNVYGPRMQTAHARQGFINWFVHLAVEGQPIRLYGDGSQLRDLVYVDDVVTALLLAVLSGDSAGQVYNVGSGLPMSLRTIAEHLVAITGAGSIEYVPFPEDARRIEIGDYVADTSLIERVLGWRAQVDLRQGLERSVRYFQTHHEQYW
jgi:UDP-glucose 4-epimerase